MKQQKTNNWQIKKLGEVCEVITGTTPSKKDEENYGSDLPFCKPPHLWDNEISFTIEEMLSYKGAKKARVVPPNTVLVTCIGNLGRTGFLKKEAAFNQQINAILENDKLIGKYIFYQAQSPSFRNQLEKLATGTTVSIVNKKNFETIEIPIPPLETQHAIVSKIEELFSELDKGIAELKTAQQQLKTYRQSVLKSAFEGKLTNENVKDGVLPDGWKSKSLKGLVLKVEKVKRKEVDENEELIYLDIGGINNDSNRIENYKKFFWKDAPSRAQQIVKQNDILFSTVRTYMKNIAIVDKEIYNNQIASSGFTVLRADTSVDYKYIYYNTISDVFLNPLNELQTGTSYPAVRDSDVLSQTINLPSSSEEQHLIVQEIESRLSVADKMEQSIQESLQKAEALRQSILKKAFSGELV